MKIHYPFLQDELALLEIRKHKWIESEKLGQEIGFATAALNWINTYGSAWLAWKENRVANNQELTLNTAQR